jgi:predicted permease
VRPLLGRTFAPADDAKDARPVLILSYAYWRNALGADPNVIGRTFEMNDRVHTVVGVLPPVPAYPEPNDVYMPVSSCPFRSAPHMLTGRNMRMVSAIGRLTPGVTLAEAQRELAAIAGRLATEHPDAYGLDTGYTATAASVRERLTSRARPTLLMLIATTGFVLLLVCANVANLTLARLAGRERELSLRTMMGAGRGRIARQLVSENLLLALGGGALGLVIAVLARGLLVTFASRFTPRATEIGVDRTVLLFAAGVSIVTGVLCAVIPAMRSRARPARYGVRGALVTAQVAISFVLLVAAGLMVRSFMKLQAVDAGFGFDADHVLTAQVDLDWVKYHSPESRRAFFRTLLATLEEQPGVKLAAWGIKFPLDQSAPFRTDFLIEERPSNGQTRKLGDYRLVSPGYFQTIGMTLVGGRAFTAEDTVDAPPVAIVNVSMARHQLGGGDPRRAVGRRISLDNGRSWTTVVGVVNDVKQYGLDTDASDELYVPFEQRGPLSATLLVRTARDPRDMQRVVERVAQGVDPRQPVSHALTLEQARRGSLESPRVTMLLVALFAVVALVVTAAGIAGVVSFAVSQRTAEIGVRMALGATCASVVGLIVGQGMRPVALGLACGVAAAGVMAPAVSRLLYAVHPTDLATYGAVIATLAVVAALACVVPARRAAAVDPMRALRSE